MNATLRIFLLVAMALALVSIAFANDWVPAEVIQRMQQPSGHPAASKDSYDRYEDALDRAAAYTNANPGPVPQPRQSVPAAQPTSAKPVFPKFVTDWVPADVIQTIAESFAVP